MPHTPLEAPDHEQCKSEYLYLPYRQSTPLPAVTSPPKEDLDLAGRVQGVWCDQLHCIAFVRGGISRGGTTAGSSFDSFWSATLAQSWPGSWGPARIASDHQAGSYSLQVQHATDRLWSARLFSFHRTHAERSGTRTAQDTHTAVPPGEHIEASGMPSVSTT